MVKKSKYEEELANIERIKRKSPNDSMNDYLEPYHKQPRKIDKNSPHRIKVIKNGKVVASADNLEVITRYNRKDATIIQMNIDCGAKLEVLYDDGAKVNTTFGSRSILEDWVDKKARRFGFKVIKKDCK